MEISYRATNIQDFRRKQNSHISVLSYMEWTMKFQVGTHDGEQIVVDLDAKTCTCRRWALSGIPYLHAFSCIKSRNYNTINFVDNCYKQDTCIRANIPEINGMVRLEEWPNLGQNPLVPLEYKDQAGKPKKARKRDPSDCSWCDKK